MSSPAASAARPAAAALTHPKYRPDIDGLRAVAVLSVVAFHAFPNAVTGGYIGVDIFFVISGFLISTILFENLERGTFSFLEFYRRRIRRIFPALSVVLLVSGVLGWGLLFNDEFQTFGAHAAAGAGFVSNLLLWQESGYFDTDSVQKPLLHLWSLGVEEQFYIVWPLCVYLGWKLRANLLQLTVVVAAASFVLNIVAGRLDPVGMFYSPLTRFWELLAGAALANLALHGSPAVRMTGAPQNIASIAGAALLIGGGVLMTKNLLFPGWWALVPIAGAVLLIAAGPQAVFNRLVLRNPVMVWFGLISYPLYLWHWPLLSFAHLVFGDTPTSYRVALMSVAVALAFATYRWVEAPVRRTGQGPMVPLLLGVMIVVCVAGAAVNVAGAGTRLGENALAPSLSKKIFGESRSGDDSCSKLLHRPPVAEEVCRANTDRPVVLFVGDSHAMALYSAVLARAVSLPAAIVAGHSCQLYPTLTNTAPRRKGWGNNCAAIAREVLEFARSVPSVRSVVIANMAVDASPADVSKWQQGSEKLSERDAFVAGNNALIAGLLAESKRVIFLTDLPTFAHTPNECVPRLPVDVPSDCVIRRVSFDEERREYNHAVATVARDNPAAVFVDPTALFCDARFCRQRDERSFLYEDRHHLSVYGSQRLINTYLRVPLGLSAASAR